MKRLIVGSLLVVPLLVPGGHGRQALTEHTLVMYPSAHHYPYPPCHHSMDCYVRQAARHCRHDHDARHCRIWHRAISSEHAFFMARITALPDPPPAQAVPPAPPPPPSPPPAAMQSALASWYDLTGVGACGAPAQAGLAFASLFLPCGASIEICHAGCVTAVMDDSGPYAAGRTFDLNLNLRDAIGCSDLCDVTYRVLR